jgi:hypothetical protein
MTPSSLNRYPDQSRTDDWILAALVVVGVLAVLGLGLAVVLVVRSVAPHAPSSLGPTL